MVLSKKQKEWWETGFSSDAQAVFDLMDSDPPAALKTLMATFIDSQVLSGNFALLDCFQFYAMDTVANAVINWIGNFSNGLLVNSPIHDPFDGITGDGVNQDINTQYNPTVDSTVGVGQNDLQFGGWLVNNLDIGNASFFGGTDGAGDVHLEQRSVGPFLRHRMNNTVTNNSGAILFQDDKLYSMRRTASGNYDVLIDKVAVNNLRASTALCNIDIHVLSNSGANFINGKVACGYACKPTGFNHDDFFDNLEIMIDETALLG